VHSQPADSPRTPDPSGRRIRRAWWAFAGTFIALVAIVIIQLLSGAADAIELLVGALVLGVGVAAIEHRAAVADLEAGRRSEAESFVRILSNLSRSVSPDAVVAAIVDELARTTGADHIVVARRRTDAHILEARLISARPGVADSSTTLPIGDLEDPLPAGVVTPRRDPVAIPVLAEALEPAPATGGLAVGVRSLVGDVATRLTGVSPARGSPISQSSHVVAETVRPQGDVQRVAERIAARTRTVYGLTNTLAAPLTVDGAAIGAIVLSHRTSGAWSPVTQRILGAAAVEASAALGRVTSQRDAETRAATDALTGLPNRRYFDEFCGLLARRRRAGDALGVLMIDVDRFKVLNDTYGHHSGDEVLRSIGAAVVGAVREDDVPARYGGEEFVVLLRNPTPEVALEVGERVRAAVGAMDLSRLGIPTVSVSVGVAVARVADQPIAELLADADRALYRAKRAGRDRVVAA
jgi:diguanylate cyclase (GGDEF)-like protein